MTTAYKYIMRKGGIHLERAYPYVSGRYGKAYKCKANSLPGKRFRIKGYT